MPIPFKGSKDQRINRPPEAAAKGSTGRRRRPPKDQSAEGDSKDQATGLFQTPSKDQSAINSQNQFARYCPVAPPRCTITLLITTSWHGITRYKSTHYTVKISLFYEKRSTMYFREIIIVFMKEALGFLEIFGFQRIKNFTPLLRFPRKKNNNAVLLLLKR